MGDECMTDIINILITPWYGTCHLILNRLDFYLLRRESLFLLQRVGTENN